MNVRKWERQKDRVLIELVGPITGSHVECAVRAFSRALNPSAAATAARHERMAEAMWNELCANRLPWDRAPDSIKTLQRVLARIADEARGE